MDGGVRNDGRVSHQQSSSARASPMATSDDVRVGVYMPAVEVPDRATAVVARR